MAVAKLVTLVLVVLLVLYLAGIFGPGPLVAGLGPVFDQALTVAVVVALALIALPYLRRRFRKQVSSANTGSGAPQAEEILGARYARGELDRDQFLQMLQDLRGLHARKT